MNDQKFIEIMNRSEYDETLFNEPGCNALKGLNIIKKYLPKSGVCGANHDVIYACNIDDLVKAGITEEDTVNLLGLNWMLEDDEYLAVFV